MIDTEIDISPQMSRDQYKAKLKERALDVLTRLEQLAHENQNYETIRDACLESRSIAFQSLFVMGILDLGNSYPDRVMTALKLTLTNIDQVEKKSFISKKKREFLWHFRENIEERISYIKQLKQDLFSG